MIPNQFRAVDPYIRRINHFDTQDSQIYLSRPTNELIRSIGDDLIIDGIHPTCIEYDGTYLTVSLCGGILIQDSTLIEIWEDIVLSLNVSEYDLDDSYFLIYTDFQYLKTPVENDISFILNKLDEHIPWVFEKNRIYCLLLKYNSETNNFSIVYANYVLVHNKMYYFRGFTNFNLAKITYEYLKRKDLFIIYDVEIADRQPPVISGDIDRDKTNQILGYNSNLLLFENSPYRPAFLENDLILIHDNTISQKYHIFQNMGNIFTRDVNPDDEIYTTNPNINDIGTVPRFHKNQYQMVKRHKNIVLKRKDLNVLECDPHENSVFDPKYFTM